MIIKFDGAEARQHHIEAYSGSESLAGVTRAATLVAHYIAAGEVRHRRPYSDELQFYIEGTERGSLSFVLTVVGTNARRAAAMTASATKLLQRVIKRATGQAAGGPLRLDETTVSAGDIDALAEAVEPGLRRAHSWINTRGKTIQFEDNDREVTLDTTTKEYLENEILDEIDIQDVSVGSLNVNGRTGRVFFGDLGRTVPFRVPKNASNRTIPMLASFLSEYADKTGATVNIRFQRILYSDRRIKRIIIYDCYPIANLN